MAKRKGQTLGSSRTGTPGHQAGDTESAAGQVLSASQEMARQAQGLRGEAPRFLNQVRAA